MKLISTVIPLAALFSVASAVRVVHGGYYDHWYHQPAVIKCFSKLRSPLFGRLVFHNVPSYPLIGGGSEAVNLLTGAGCGSCWEISHNGKSVNITAVDTAKDGFTTSGKSSPAN